MKRIAFVLAVVALLIGGMTFTDYPPERINVNFGVDEALAVDTSGQNYAIAIGNVTLDSAFDVAWEIIDSMIITAPETASISFTVSGIARLDPGDVFWLGFTDIRGSLLGDSLSVSASRNMDSVRIQGLGRWARGRMDLPFSFTTVDTINRAITDTFFLMGAAGGSANIDEVELRRVVLEIFVGGVAYP